MDDIPSVTALHDGARYQQPTSYDTRSITIKLQRPIGFWECLAYIGDYSPMDDIPSVTALHDGARKQQVTNAIWVLGMTCQHRVLFPYG